MDTSGIALPDGKPSFFSALVSFGLFIPFIASVSLSMSYIWSGNYNWAWQYSILIVSVLWIGFAFLLRGFTTPERAQVSSFLSFRARFDALESTVRCSEAYPADGVPAYVREGAIADVGACVNGIVTQLTPPSGGWRSWFDLRGLQWLSGDGYLGLWDKLQRAEEALIPLVPAPELVGMANLDESRIQGSGIAEAGNLRYQLLRARQVIRTNTGLSSIWDRNQPDSEGIRSLQGGGEDVGSLTAIDVVTARENVKAVRQAVNQYREGRRAALIASRNRLYATVFVTTLFLFVAVLLTIVVASQLRGTATSEETIRTGLTAGVAFFVVGGTVGLFGRLYADAGASGGDGSVEDYGLSNARLIHAAVLSGLAGVIGAAVVPILGAFGETSVDLPRLSQIFSLAPNVSGLLFAAIFGLAPSALIGRLQQQAEQYKSDLAKSEAASPTQ